MKTLAFDQATLKTGFAIMEGKAMTGYGVIDLSKSKDDSYIRCRKMVMEIYKIIMEQNPDQVVIEDCALQKNPATLIMLARIQGGIISLCDSMDKPIRVYKPSEWRKRIGMKQARAKREQLKEMAQEFVKLNFGIDVSDDEADAICLASVTHKFEEE